MATTPCSWRYPWESPNSSVKRDDSDGFYDDDDGEDYVLDGPADDELENEESEELVLDEPSLTLQERSTLKKLLEAIEHPGRKIEVMTIEAYQRVADLLRTNHALRTELRTSEVSLRIRAGTKEVSTYMQRYAREWIPRDLEDNVEQYTNEHVHHLREFVRAYLASERGQRPEFQVGNLSEEQWLKLATKERALLERLGAEKHAGEIRICDTLIRTFTKVIASRGTSSAQPTAEPTPPPIPSPSEETKVAKGSWLSKFGGRVASLFR